MSAQLRYLMCRVASKRELVRNPTSFIRVQPMHTDTVAGHAKLSLRSKVIVALFIGTNSVGVSYFGRDPVFSQGVKSFWPPLNRKYQDAFSIATDIMKIKEEHELCWLVVGRPWFSQRARAALNHINQFAKEQMEEHVIVVHVMSNSIEEGEADNDLNDGAAKVDSFFEDLMSTGILTGIEIIYYNASAIFNQLRVKKMVEQLTIEGDSRFLFADITELEVRYAVEFLLMHFMANEVFVQMPNEVLMQTPVVVEVGSLFTRMRSNQNLVVDLETASKEYEFFMHNLGNMILHWKF